MASYTRFVQAEPLRTSSRKQWAWWTWRRCTACGYSLAALPAGVRCPECGHENDKPALVAIGETSGDSAVAKDEMAIYTFIVVIAISWPMLPLFLPVTRMQFLLGAGFVVFAFYRWHRRRLRSEHGGAVQLHFTDAGVVRREHGASALRRRNTATHWKRFEQVRITPVRRRCARRASMPLRECTGWRIYLRRRRPWRWFQRNIELYVGAYLESIAFLRGELRRRIRAAKPH